MIIEIREFSNKSEVYIDDKNINDITDEELLDIIKGLINNSSDAKRSDLEDLFIASILVSKCRIVKESNANNEFYTLFETYK